ncbi:IclR family transcriptional regulator [Arthrobacter sp. zg-Y820]|uniref:IclR family transcriptional regulator n=1 Tax=unclassified Arthrobacter TaxID=235627 RepID=UPI0024C38F69|nr:MULTISPECIES: IclR family transcriptional regulator [unclassified Arthrobacter]MDK1280442.1 IclR family transcriptional regulator [Arthrobacter sp. zg.Y820]MDK1361957.1 IclR family transcriptional regulator [Arthrobacter sp. zg-Y1219]WIB10914.1 IclR family transcriptional regulator [Arthrobacter sp. zg-Y820]
MSPTASTSQTLSRGIRALEVMADATGGLTIAEIAAALDVHRSISYRILRTLEEHSLVLRDDAGRFSIGPGMATLARGVGNRLQTVAIPELTALSSALQMTAFISVWDRRQCVTLVSVEPPRGDGTIVQRPGTRHSFAAGATGIAIQSAVTEAEWEELAPGEAYREESRTAARLGYAFSRDEVIPGVSSVAVPVLASGQLPAALAVVYLTSDVPAEQLAARVLESAAAIEQLLR